MSGNDYWTLALVIGLVAALVVVVLLVLLLQSIGRIRRSVSGLLEVAGKVAATLDGETPPVPVLLKRAIRTLGSSA